LRGPRAEKEESADAGEAGRLPFIMGETERERKMSRIQVKQLVVGMVQTNCYIVYDEETKRAVIVDPGDRAEEINDALRELGVKPEAILLTHGHFDHIMAAASIKEEWGLAIYAGEKELEVLRDGEKNMMKTYYRKPLSLEPDVTLKDNEVFGAAGITWKMFETPGHTIGSCCYYAEDEKILFSGDTLFRASYGRVDFPTGNAMDMLASVKRLLTELPPDVMVYPGHMDVTTIDFEKKNNPLARY